MAKSEFGDDVEKTTVLGLKDLELLSPDKTPRSAYLICINGRAVGFILLAFTYKGECPDRSCLSGPNQLHSKVAVWVKYWGLVHKVSLASNQVTSPPDLTDFSPVQNCPKMVKYWRFWLKNLRFYVEYGQFSTRVFAECGDKLNDV